MSVKIRFNQVFTAHTGGRDTLDVEGRTIRDCLNQVIAIFPELKDQLFNANNELSCLIIAGGQAVLPSGLESPISDSTEIHLLPMIFGG